MNEQRILHQTIYFDGKQYFDSLIADITHARQEILLETYIYNPDSIGVAVTEALAAAARRKVKVKVLIDGAGSPRWSGQLAKQLDEAGVQTRIFHPFPWSLWQWSRSYVRVNFLLKAIYLLLKINSRNHRKICIIDRKTAYIGSFNISKVHLQQKDGGEGWRDVAVRLEHINLQELIKAFRAAWKHRPIKERIQNIFRPLNKHPLIRLNNTRFRRRTLYKELLERISHCKERIWMINAYFIPDNFLLHYLGEAAKRGVDVRIILPRKSDVFFMPWTSATFYRSLLKAGVHIFEYLPSMLHAKTLIIDDWMMVGSSNLNHRSLLHDLEVDVEIRNAAAKQKLEDIFLEDLKHTEEVELQWWQKKPWYQRLLGRLVLYLKYWI